MSRYSGKCDFYDWIDINSEKKTESGKVEVTIGDKKFITNYNDSKALSPYYPFLVAFGSGNREEDGSYTSIIHLCRRSFITQENEEMMEIFKADLVRYFNRCKRKKEQYDPDEAVKISIGSFCATEDILELAKRVGEKGKKASIEGLIWTPLVNHYREDWKKAMIDSGWSEEDAEDWIKKDSLKTKESE